MSQSWTTPGDLRTQLLRRWERGELLRPLVSGESCYPLRLKLKGPGSSDLSAHFEAVRAWVAELSAMPRIRIEWRDVRHRVQGAQRLPAQAWVDTPGDAFALIGKGRDAERFATLVKITHASTPTLLPWLAGRPMRALALAEAWPRLLAVIRWLREHPRPGIYLRQMDVPGVHTKFVEAHRGVLAELLDLALPSDAVAAEISGVANFTARYGFRDKPVRLRFRILDERLGLLAGARFPDVTLDAGSFATLGLPLRRVFITENETNFLAFPQVRDAIVLFGAGYGWEALARTRWLRDCELHYWGDIDTHGFAILDQLRARLPQVSSFLMDRRTLFTHEVHWGEEPAPIQRDLPHLTADEGALFDELRDNRIRENLRLEQERIGFSWLCEAVARLTEQPQADQV